MPQEARANPTPGDSAFDCRNSADFDRPAAYTHFGVRRIVTTWRSTQHRNLCLMEVDMVTQAIRRTLVFVALATLPGFVAAAGSQAGDDGRRPIGADTDSPRQAIPSATTNDGVVDYGTSY